MPDRKKNPDAGISPAEAGRMIGHSREFIVSLIDASELPATDERRPGAKIPRYRIDPADVLRWKQSRSVTGWQ